MTIGVVSCHLLTFRGQRSQEGVRKWGVDVTQGGEEAGA